MFDVWKKTLEELNKDSSFSNMFHMMKKYGTRIAAELTNSEGRLVTMSYADYIIKSKGACAKLQKLGCSADGKFIALIYDTCMEWPVLFWGILMSGNIPLLINPASDADLILSIMNEAHATAYVSAEERFDDETEVFSYIPAESLLKDTENLTCEECFGSYVALCTSGTTGNSRIFLYDGPTIASHILSFDEAKQNNPDMPFIEGRPCKILAFLPFHHIFGFSVVYLLYSCTGKTLVYLKDKSARTILNACRMHKVTHLYCIPMFFNNLADGIKKTLEKRKRSVKNPLIKEIIKGNTLGTSIRSMITGGGAIPDTTLQILNDVGYPLCNGFGMTECGIISVEQSQSSEQRQKGSIGIPFAVTEWKLEPEGAQEGELFIKGNALYAASVINGEIVQRDKNTWFATGDIVRVTEDGLFVAGRAKDVIVGASGENIYPEDIEANLHVLDVIGSYCVLGVKSGIYETVAIVIYPRADADEQKFAEKIKEINKEFSADAKIARLYISREELPVSGTLKVRRALLKEKIENGSWPCSMTEIYAVKNTKFGRAPYETPTKAEYEKSDYEDKDEFKAILENVRITAEKIFEQEIPEDAVKEHFIMALGVNSLEVFSFITELESVYKIEISNDEMLALENCYITAKLIYCRLHKLPSPITIKQHMDKKLSAEELFETSRITDFSESAEYKAIKNRMAETFADCPNPYFLPHDSVIRDTSVINGKEVVNLGSYNYLGMSGNPETMEAAIEAIKRYGTSASGSRTLAGEKTLYQKLEKTIAEWKHTEDAIVCTGGWATNLAFVSCFAKRGDFIVYDKLSHNSLTEGAKLSDAESKAFEHNNLIQLEEILKRAEGKYNKVLIIVEGVYSMDGDIAPIPEFVRLKKKYKAFLMVDEAHSGCVIGEYGGGVDDYFHLDPKDIDIKYGTLSKGLGACGGYIAADASIVEYLRYQMNGFVFTAGIAPPLAAEVIRAIEIIQRDNTMVTKLHENIAYFIKRAKEEGMNTCLAGESAIVPVLIGSDAQAAKISALLLEKGIFVPPAMYPAVPMGESRLRFTISATHNKEQLEKAVCATAEIMRKEGALA